MVNVDISGRTIGIDDLAVIAAAPREGDGFRSIAEAARIIASRIRSSLGYDRVSLTLLPAVSGDLSDPELPAAVWAHVLEASETGIATLISDLHERPEPELAGLAAAGSWRAAAFVPVIARGRLIGTLNAFSVGAHEHGAAEVDALVAAARVAGIAIDTVLAAQRSASARGDAPELNDEFAEAQTDLARLVRTPTGDAVHAICELLEARLGTSVLVWDVVGGKTRALAGSAEFRSRMTEVLGARDPGRLGRLREGVALDSAMAHPIGRERTLGLLVIDGWAGERPHPADRLVQLAVALLAFDLESERAERTARNVSRPSILHALVSGRLSSRQATDVGTFVDATGQALRIGFLSVTDDVVATATSHRLNFSARTRGCLAAAAEQDGVLLLVEDADPAKLRATLLTLVESVSPGTWSLGVSEPFSDLADARVALQQAHIALTSSDTRQISLHDEMGPTVALLKHLPPGAAAQFVEEMLRPLIEYDRERNGALVETLSAYLRHRGSLRRAADELFVHSNTVQLRLGRAAQLTGVDLHDPRQLGMLSLAFAWRGDGGSS
jgi:hypothetical protein